MLSGRFLRTVLYLLVVTAQVGQPIAGAISPRPAAALGGNRRAWQVPRELGDEKRPPWTRPDVQPKTFPAVSPPAPLPAAPAPPHPAEFGRQSALSVPEPFPFGNNNFGHSYGDSGNPEDHPGRHFAGPVNAINGNLFLTVGDHFYPAPGLSVQFARSYNHADSRVGPLGRGWTHSYNTAVVTDTGALVVIREADGSLYPYTFDGIDWNSPPGIFRQLEHAPGGSYTLFHKNGVSQNFDPFGRLTLISDRNGNSLQLAYDGLNRLVTVLDSSNPPRPLTLLYDHPTNPNLLTAVMDPIGRATSYLYDPNNNLTGVAYPEGSAASYSYDGLNRLASYNDPRQPPGESQALFQYDPTNQVTQVNYPLGRFFLLFYFPAGTAWQDAVGGVTGISFDAGFNVTFDGVFYNDCGCYRGDTLNYDGNLLLRGKNDPAGNLTLYDYDPLGNLIRVTAPDGAQTVYTYSPLLSNVLSTSDPGGDTIAYTYDVRGNLINELRPGGALITYTNDIRGQLVGQTDALGHTMAYSYDALGNLLAVADPAGGLVSHSYDMVGRVTQTIDPAGGVTTYQYDATDRLTQVTDPLGGTIQYTYDNSDNLLTLTDANGHALTHTYDALDRLTSVTGPLGQSTTYQYDPAGRLALRTDPLGATTAYTYDEASRMVQRTYSDGRQDRFAYDTRGNLTVMGDGALTTTMTYNGGNMLESVHLDAPGFFGPGSDPFITYTYDLVGNRVQATVGDGTGLWQTSYVYDAMNRLVQTYDQDGRTWTTTYDDDGRRLTRTLPDNSHEEYNYDGRNNLVELRHYDDGNVLQRVFTHDYDLLNNMTLDTDGSQVSTYAYDALSRMTQASTPLGQVGYTYDAVGNRLTVTGPSGTNNFTYNAANLLLSSQDTTYQYDLMGRRVGDQGPLGSRSFAYDGEMRLDSFFDIFNSVTLDYDPLGQLIRKNSNGDLTFYLYGDGRLEAELTAAGTAERRYTIDTEIVAMSLVSAAPVVVTDFHYDGRGRVRWVTDAAGNTVAEYTGDPTEDAANFYNPVRVGGTYFIPEMGLYLLGDGQFIDPWSGTFLCRFWPWVFWPFGPYSPWISIFRYWPWPWPWPRPWGWTWPRPWAFLWPWPGIWVRPFLIWPMWPWPVQPWLPWWWWRSWWGWFPWAHWWLWRTWWWWCGWWHWGWWGGWWWWPWWWLPWWWWWPCWWVWWVWWLWWLWIWWWWPWWWPWWFWWRPCWWGWFWWPPYWLPYFPRPPDYGDAPDPPYPSLLLSNGARHWYTDLEWLGPTVDREFDAEITDLDLYDDGVAVDLASGVVSFTVSTAGFLSRYGPAAPVHVHGWIDWNSDGDWLDPGEFVLNWSGYPGDGVWPPLVSGVTVVAPIPVPPVLPFSTWARFRLDYAQNVETVTGPARYGEVEDYHLYTQPFPPGWSGGVNVSLVDPLVVVYPVAMITSTVSLSITPFVATTLVWSTSPLDGGADTLTILHDPFAPLTTYTLTLSAGQTVNGHWLPSSTYTFTTESGLTPTPTIAPTASHTPTPTATPSPTPTATPVPPAHRLYLPAIIADG